MSIKFLVLGGGYFGFGGGGECRFHFYGRGDSSEQSTTTRHEHKRDTKSRDLFCGLFHDPAGQISTCQDFHALSLATVFFRIISGVAGNLCRGPRTTHHPDKRPSSSGGILGGVVCELSEPKQKAKYAPPPVLHSRC